MSRSSLASAPAAARAATTATLIAALVAAIAVVAPAGAATSKPRKAPAGLAFYAPPASALAGPHGSVIWSRPIGGAVTLTGAAKSTLVLYRSRGLDGKPNAVSGIVSIPRGKAPKGGWPVITWAHGTTGMADSCAPSRDPGRGEEHALVSYVNPVLNAWLRKGYAVVRTDYPGLGTAGPHGYLVGHSEARGIIDIVRAARQLNPGISNRVAIAGHSQGGQAALFAAADMPAWAPELNLRGVAAYAPASHLKEQVAARGAFTSPGGFLSAEGGLIVAGAATTSSSINLPSILSPAANRVLPQINQVCLGSLAAANSWGGLAPATLIRDGANLGPLNVALGAMNPALKIRTPILLLQGDKDTTVFPAFTTQLKGELTAKRDSVDYRTFPGVDHGGIVSAAATVAQTWLAARLK